MTALSIPFPDSGAGDWHLLHAFSGGPEALIFAGESDTAFINTNAFLGASGVQECSDILRRAGIFVETGFLVFAASPQRAIVDLLVSHVRRGMERSYLPLEDFFDTPEEVERLSDFVHQNALSLPLDERRFVMSHIEHLAALDGF